MYLSQTNLEVDTTKVFDLNGQDVYLTIPVAKGRRLVVTKAGYEKEGRDCSAYALDYQRKRQIKEKI